MHDASDTDALDLPGHTNMPGDGASTLFAASSIELGTGRGAAAMQPGAEHLKGRAHHWGRTRAWRRISEADRG